MNPERTHMKGMLYENERTARKLDAQCKGAIMLIRQLLNPYEDNVCKLDLDAAKAAMDKLCSDTEELQKVTDKIRRLKEDLE